VNPAGPGSLWFDQVPDRDPLDPLDGDAQADVVVVGAGLTGLWTAYYLLEADPSLDVLLVEQVSAGFGASGRAGGWCSAQLPVTAEALARTVHVASPVAGRAAGLPPIVTVRPCGRKAVAGRSPDG